MNAIEFTTELSGAATLQVPIDVAAQLPTAGKARVIVLTDEGTDEAEWRAAAYEQFLRDDSMEDAADRLAGRRFAQAVGGSARPARHGREDGVCSSLGCAHG